MFWISGEYLSIYLSIYLSVRVCVCARMYVSVCAWVRMYVFMHKSIYQSIYPYVSVYVCIYLSAYLPIYLSIWKWVSSCVCMYACMYVSIYLSIYVVNSISSRIFLHRHLKLKVQYVIAIHLMRWLTNFYNYRFKWAATAGIGIYPTKAWLSQLVNFKNAIWTWGHFRKMIYHKILF